MKVLKSINLDVFDARIQGYDNGSNMKGRFMSCACHSLNHALCDMVESCV